MIPSLDPTFDLVSILVIFAGLAMGGVLKGATGAGAPVVAVPVMAAFFDVKLAVILMVMPNLVTNTTQLLRYHAAHLPRRFSWKFAGAGAVGAIVGTFILASARNDVLSLMIAGSVVLYIALRLLRPDFRLDMDLAHRLVWPIGAFAGVLQGAAGISAPVSVSFLNAMRLERLSFIASISAFFGAMALVQLPMLVTLDLLSWHRVLISLAAVVPLLAFMPVGNWLARKLSAKAFDRVVLVFLSVLAVRLIWVAVAPG